MAKNVEISTSSTESKVSEQILRKEDENLNSTPNPSKIISDSIQTKKGKLKYFIF